MTAFRTALGALAFAGFISAVPAHAQEAADVGERLKTMFKNQGVDLAYSAISGDADEMTVEGVTVKPEGETEALPISELTLTDISEDAGTISIGSLSMDRYAVSQDGLDVVIDGVEITGLSLPSPAQLDQMVMYDSAELAQFSVAKDGEELFALIGFSVEVTPPEGGSPLAFTGSADKFTADLTQIEDPAARQVAEEMGYTTLTGSLEAAGSWNPADGRTVLSQYDLTIDNAGTIGFMLDISGYTAEFQKALRETQSKLAAAPEGQDNSAAGMAMLGLMQQLNFHGATIRFEDDALTGKVLDYFAKQQGARSIDIANQAKALLPFVLAQLNNPEFAAQITEAASKFLDAPQSLTITAKPAAPVPFAMVAAGAMTAPESLPQQLGVTVTANE